MSNVIVDKQKIDILANAIADKSGAPVTMTLDEMKEAVDGIRSPVIQSLAVTPSESQQTFNASGVDGYKPVTVNAISSTYVGSGITRRSSTDMTVSGATVTAPAGYYAFAASKAVASGTVTAPASISGTSATVSTGTNTLTLTKTVSVTPVVSTAGYVSSGTAGNSSVSLTASVNTRSSSDLTVSGGTVTAPAGYYGSAASKSVSAIVLPISLTTQSVGTKKASILSSLTTQYLNIPTGYNADAQYYEVLPIDVGTKTITENGTYYAYMDGHDGFSSVTVNVSGGGGGGGTQIGTKTTTHGTASASISFTGLSGEPTSFVVISNDNLATGASPYKAAAVVWDGSSLHGQTITNTNNAQVSYDGSGFSKSYSNGTLTITGTGSYFQNNEYTLVYSYGGTAASIDTADVQVGSGATSITFTGLSDEPTAWSCIFKSNFSTSSGYQRVIAVVYDGSDTYGMEMDSSAHYSDTHWSYTYNNGSLTISSQGTNAGGYFHQPGYYQLTAVYGEASPYQAKTVNPTTSQQIIEADSGYEALSRVTVNAMPTMTLPSSASGTSSGTSKATITPTSSAQYLNIPTGYNGTAQYYTIAASGGGSSTVATKTITNSSNQNTSISFTNIPSRPIAFFVRCTGSLARSSSSSYYYVADIAMSNVNNVETVVGNSFRMSNGTYADVTSGYSFSYSGTTLTVSSSGSRSAAPGSFYNSGYELTYIY